MLYIVFFRNKLFEIIFFVFYYLSNKERRKMIFKLRESKEKWFRFLVISINILYMEMRVIILFSYVNCKYGIVFFLVFRWVLGGNLFWGVLGNVCFNFCVYRKWFFFFILVGFYGSYWCIEMVFWFGSV